GGILVGVAETAPGLEHRRLVIDRGGGDDQGADRVLQVEEKLVHFFIGEGDHVGDLLERIGIAGGDEGALGVIVLAAQLGVGRGGVALAVAMALLSADPGAGGVLLAQGVVGADEEKIGIFVLRSAGGVVADILVAVFRRRLELRQHRIIALQARHALGAVELAGEKIIVVAIIEGTEFQDQAGLGQRIG